MKEKLNIFKTLIGIERSALGQSQNLKGKKNRRNAYILAIISFVLIAISTYRI